MVVRRPKARDDENRTPDGGSGSSDSDHEEPRTAFVGSRSDDPARSDDELRRVPVDGSHVPVDGSEGGPVGATPMPMLSGIRSVRPIALRGSASPRTTARALTEKLSARERELEAEVEDLRGELARAERRIDAMKQIGRALGSNLDLEPLLGAIVARTTELLDADRTTLFLVDHDRRRLWSKVVEGNEAKEISLPFGVGIAGWVAEHGDPENVRDAYGDPRFNAEVDKRSGYRTRTILAWPVRRPHGSDLIGVIQVLNKRRGSFMRADERLLEAIASEIGVALEVAALFREKIEHARALDRARAELALLLETERAISEATTLDAMLDSILATALGTMRASGGAIYVASHAARSLARAAAAGSRMRSFPGTVGRDDEGPIAEVARTGRPFRADTHATLGGRDPTSKAVDDVAESLLAIPIRTRASGLLGVLALVHRDSRGEFDDEDERSLSVVAAQIARAIAAERRRRDRERSSRLMTIGRMLSGVVHDLKTPTTLISGYAEMMASASDPEERAECERRIARQIEIISSMTNDLLAFARGERALLVRKVLVRRFMEEMKDYLQREFEGSGVVLELEVGCRGHAHFDETKIRRVFSNIARNAREAMPGGGRFVVSVSREGAELVFRFTDTGTGVPSELNGALFEPFGTIGKPGGTGLGLAMVKQIAEDHGGHVSYTTSPKGTTFVFRIPSDT